MIYLLDTNIIIYHLDGLLPQLAQNKIDAMLVKPLPLSIITKIELLGFRFATTQQKITTQLFVKPVQWLLLTNTIANQAILLRQNHKLKTPDAIIAATAIVHNYTLVSRNDKDFGNIPSLQYINPFS